MAEIKCALPKWGLFLASAATALIYATGAAAEGEGANAPTNGGASVGEVVVTAQRRAERLQDVPIAITALSGAQMQRLGVTGSKQLSQVTPGLYFPQSVYSPQPTIRGIGTRGVGSGDESIVPIYINGVYQPFITSLDLQFSNVDRVEVLKGPQGALLGRNATGGAINIITKQPGAGFTGDASLSYGRFNDVVGKLYLSGGNELVSADIALIRNRNNGYIHDVVANRNYGAMDDLAVRSQLRLRATSAAELTLALGYVHNHDSTGEAYQPLNGNTIARSFIPTLTQSVSIATTPYTSALGLIPFNQVVERTASAVGKLHFSAFDLTSVTGYQFDVFTAAADSDATPFLASSLFVGQSSENFYQEVYATSKLPGPLSWIVGAVYYHDNALNGPAADPISGTVSVSASGVQTTTRTNTDLTTSSIALYAQATYKFSEALSATFGGRYTSDVKHYTTANVSPVPGPTIVGAATFNRFTPSGSIIYRVNPHLNFYFKGGQAFKAGLFTLVNGVVTPVPEEDVTQYEVGMKSQPLPWLRVNLASYYTDYRNIQSTARDATNTSFTQAGANARIYGFEAEIVAHPIDNLNLQAGLSWEHGTYVHIFNSNGSVKTLQVTSPKGPAPTGGATATSCPAGVAPPCGNNNIFIDPNGKSIIRTPFLTLNFGGDYTVPLPYGDLIASGNLYYAGPFYWDQLNRLVEPAHTLLNGELTYRSPNRKYSVSLWGENLLNTRYDLTVVTSTSDTRVFAEPISYGVRVEVRW